MRSLILLMVATLAFAQDKPDDKKAPEPAPQAMEAEVIQVKTLTGDSITRLMKLLEVFHAHVQGDSQLRTIVVYAPKDVVAQMRRVVEQLDRPGSEAAVGRNIEIVSPAAPPGSAVAAIVGDRPRIGISREGHDVQPQLVPQYL